MEHCAQRSAIRARLGDEHVGVGGGCDARMCRRAVSRPRDQPAQGAGLRETRDQLDGMRPQRCAVAMSDAARQPGRVLGIEQVEQLFAISVSPISAAAAAVMA